MPFSPDAPEEIWLNIFRLAAECPRSPALDDPSRKLPNLYQARESLGRKSELALVCCRWNRMVAPMLYEHVSLNSEPQLESLRDTIDPSGSASPRTNLRPSKLAGLIKKLDMSFGFDLLYPRDREAWNRNLGPTLDDTLGQIRLQNVMTLVISLPYLTSLDVQLDFHIADPFLLLNALPQSLEYLRWASVYGGYIPIPLHRLLDVFQEHPNLTSVSVPFSFDNTPLDAAYLEGKAWPSIREWVAQAPTYTYPIRVAQSVTISDLPQGALPNVQTVEFPHELQRNTLDSCERWILAHGNGLLSVGLVLSETDSGFEISLLERVAKRCLSIHRVHLFVLDHSAQGAPNAERWVDRASTFFKMPTITELVLSFDRSSDVGEVQRFESIPWTRVFPNLKEVRTVQDIDTDRYRHLDCDRRLSYMGFTLMSKQLAKRTAALEAQRPL